MLSVFCLTDKNESEQTIMKRIKINPIFVIIITYLSIFLTAQVVYATNEVTEITYVSSKTSHVNEDKLQLIFQEKIAVIDIIYKHGECNWLPQIALEAGWQVNQLKQLRHIALRESGCCPNRAGGDMVDKNCNITGVSEWNHRSDSGLLQINGINYDMKRNPYAPICKKMNICSKKDQWQLFDPLTNLKAGKLLFDYWEKAAGDGWIPWDICNRKNTCK